MACFRPSLAPGRTLLLVSLALFLATAALGRGEMLPLWKVERPTGEGGVLWLLGSIHMRAADRVSVDRIIAETVEEADLVAVEADPDNQEAILTAVVAEFGLLPESSTLFDLLPPDRHAALREALSSIPAAMDLKRFRPWFASILISVHLAQSCGYRADRGIDHVVLARSRGKKQIVELEDPLIPLKAMADLPPEVEIADLENALDSFMAGCQEVGVVFSAWERGDLATIECYMAELLRESPRIEPLIEAIMYRRSRYFADRIEERFGTSRSPLVILGVGHMVGPENIPELLAERGFLVTRVAASGEEVDFSLPPPVELSKAPHRIELFTGVGFSILLPGTPVSSRQKPRSNGPTVHIYQLEVDQTTAYVITAMPFPQALLPGASLDVLLDKSVGALCDALAFEVRDPALTLSVAGHQARLVRGVLPGSTAELLFIATPNALYQLTIAWGDGVVLSLPADAFFASFRLEEE